MKFIKILMRWTVLCSQLKSDALSLGKKSVTMRQGRGSGPV